MSLPSLTIITLPASQAAPSGYSFLGTSSIVYYDATNKLKTMSVKLYQKL